MIQEEKQLLLKDLSARLPYGVQISIKSDYTNTLETMALNCFHLDGTCSIEYRMLRPYLRPLSIMTEEEEEEFKRVLEIELDYLASNEEGHTVNSAASITFQIDFYNRHHFDYRGLIEKGLALEAPEGMYKTK